MGADSIVPGPSPSVGRTEDDQNVRKAYLARAGAPKDGCLRLERPLAGMGSRSGSLNAQYPRCGATSPPGFPRVRSPRRNVRPKRQRSVGSGRTRSLDGDSTWLCMPHAWRTSKSTPRLRSRVYIVWSRSTPEALRTRPYHRRETGSTRQQFLPERLVTAALLLPLQDPARRDSQTTMVRRSSVLAYLPPIT